VATVGAVDQDAGNTFGDALVTGNGTNDADNGLVTVIGNEIQVKSGAVIDYETNPVLNLNVQVTDNWWPDVHRQRLGVGVTNVNQVPTDIALTNAG
jgi:hypothetical protein